MTTPEYFDYLVWLADKTMLIPVVLGLFCLWWMVRFMQKDLTRRAESEKADPEPPADPALPRPGERWRKLPCDRHPTIVEVFDVVEEGPWSTELEGAAACGCLIRTGEAKPKEKSFDDLLKATVAEAKKTAKEATLYAEQILARRALDAEQEASRLREASLEVGKTYEETLLGLVVNSRITKGDADSTVKISEMTAQELQSLAARMEEELKSQGKLSEALLRDQGALNAEETLFREKVFGGVTHTPTGLIWPKMPVLRKSIRGSSIERALEAYIEKHPDKVAGILDRASRARPQEFDFPGYMGVIDKLACTWVPTRFLRKLNEEARMFLGAPWDNPQDLYTLWPRPIGPCEAVLFVRPYVVPLVPPTHWAEWLHDWGNVKLRIQVDDEIYDTPLEDHLVAPDGFGLRKKPFSFFPGWSGYLTGAESKNPAAHYGYCEVPSAYTDLGIVLTRDSSAKLWLVGIPHVRSQWEIRVGAVLGLYTTKAIGAA